MKTVVYLDVLLLVNFTTSIAGLLCAGLLSGRGCSAVRLIAGGALGAVSALALLAPPLPPGLSLGYKAATCGAAVAAVYGWPGTRGFARLCGWYLLFNLMLCGAVLLPGAQANNLSVYLPLSPGRLLGCTAAVYGALRGMMYIFGRAGTASFAATLQLAGASVAVQAFYDTGFALQEPLSGRVVVLVHYPAVRDALPEALRAYMDKWFASGAAPPPELGVRFVPCRAVTGSCLLPAVPAQSLHCARGSAENLLAAFCCPPTPPEHWTLLLGTDTARHLGLV